LQGSPTNRGEDEMRGGKYGETRGKEERAPIRDKKCPVKTIKQKPMKLCGRGKRRVRLELGLEKKKKWGVWLRVGGRSHFIVQQCATVGRKGKGVNPFMGRGEGGGHPTLRCREKTGKKKEGQRIAGLAWDLSGGKSFEKKKKKKGTEK